MGTLFWMVITRLTGVIAKVVNQESSALATDRCLHRLKLKKKKIYLGQLNTAKQHTFVS